MARAISISTP
jgi:hypothetical protein